MTPDVQAIVAEAWASGWTVSVSTPAIIAMTKGDRVLAVALQPGGQLDAAATNSGCILGRPLLRQVLNKIQEAAA